MARLQQAQGIVPGLQHLARMISSNNAFHCQGLGSALASFSSASAPDAASQMALIKALREKTSAPISDVKKCLAAAGWNPDAAYDLLRKKGLAAAAKKASRQATEGLVGVASKGGLAALVEINSETDFVARNELFTKLVSQVSQAALQINPSAAAPGTAEVPIEQVASTACAATNSTIGDAVVSVAAQMRENIKLRRAFLLSVAPQTGVLSTYVHMPAAPGLGRIASAVALESADGKSLPEAARPALEELGNGLAMHVAGMRPLYVSRDDVPAEALARERAVLTEQATTSQPGKPQAVLDKMVTGRLGKFYQDVCLMEQKYVLDDSLSIKALLDKAGKDAGVKLRVARMLRVQCGEGLQVAKANFAEEVADMAKGSK